MAGTLYLIPTTLGNTPENNTIPEYTLDILRKLDVLMVENIRSATSFLQWVGDTIPEYEIDFYHLNKNTPDQEIHSFLKPRKKEKMPVFFQKPELRPWQIPVQNWLKWHIKVGSKSFLWLGLLLFF